RAEAGVHDGHLGNGCVDDARGTEAVDEALGDFEGAAIDADVFADAEDGGIALHLFPDALADRFEVGDRCHVCPMRLRLTILSAIHWNHFINTSAAKTEVPRRLKPVFDRWFAARLKPCPFKSE